MTGDEETLAAVIEREYDMAAAAGGIPAPLALARVILRSSWLAGVRGRAAEEALREAASWFKAVEALHIAYADIVMDTAQDQETHDKLVEIADFALPAALRAARPGDAS